MSRKSPADFDLETQPARRPPIIHTYGKAKTWRQKARAQKRELLSNLQALFQQIVFRRRTKDKIKLVVFSPPRTGSTLLFDLLDCHPAIQSDRSTKSAEVFHDRFLWPQRYVEARAALCPAKVYAFKLQPCHLVLYNSTDPAPFLRTLHQRRWQIVYLTRRNLFRQALSATLAYQTQVWHQSEKETKLADQPVALDVPLLCALLEMYAQDVRYTDDLMAHLPHLKLIYEDDLEKEEQQQPTADKVFDFLGLPHHCVTTKYRRTGKDDWRQMISNADEVIAALRGTPHEIEQ